jgi:hypothetical protein
MVCKNRFAFAPFIWHSNATEILELYVDTPYSTSIEKDESAGNVTRDHSEDVNTDEEIILKWSLNKHDYSEWTGPVAEGLSTKRRVIS